MLKNERRVVSLSVVANSYPKTAPIHSSKNLVQILKQIFDEGLAQVVLDDTGALPSYSSDSDAEFEEGTDLTNSIYIADVEFDQKRNRVCFLINRGDPTRANPAFINSQIKDVKIVQPPEGYASGNSAHIVMSYSEDISESRLDSMILERAEGIPRTLLFNFFNLLLKRHAEKEGLEYEKKNRKMSSYRPRFNQHLRMGKSLEQDLNDGYVTAFELIGREKDYQGPDEESEVFEVRRRVKYLVSNMKDVSKVTSLFNRLRGKAKADNFSEIQIHLGGMEGVSSSPKFSLEVEEAADLVYGRVENVFFDESLERGYAKISDTIKNAMYNKLSELKE